MKKNMEVGVTEPFTTSTECPSFLQSRRDIFLDQLPLSNTEWSVRGLLSFSYIPAISTALEGDTRIELFDMRENDQMDDNSNTHHPDDDS